MSPGCGEPSARSLTPMTWRETVYIKELGCLILVTDDYQGNASNQRNRSKDRRKRNCFLLFRSGFDRSDVDHLLTGCIGNSLIGEGKDRKDNQNNSDKDCWLHHRFSFLALCP